jgi:sugar lactone lactonase YvrE
LGSDPAAGRILYVADRDNNAIRKLDLDLNQTITFLTGKINQPVGVALDGDGNLYVLNHGNGSNGSVLKFNRFGNFLGTTAAALINANGIALDGGTNIYVTVNGNAVIKISPGSFPGAKTNVATINIANTSLQGVAVTSSGYLAVCDSGNHGIWMINPTTGETNRLTGFAGAGDAFGVPGAARFNQPYGIAAAGGGMLVVTDYGNHRVKTVDASGNVCSLYGVCSSNWTVAPGNPSVFPGWWDGNGCSCEITCQICDNFAEARLPFGVVVAPDGSVYTTEVYYHLIRHTTATGLAGPQPGSPPLSPSFNGPMGIALDTSGSLLFIADQTNNAIRVLDFGDNSTTTFLGTSDGINRPASVLVDPNNNIFVLNQGTGGNGSILEFDTFGNLLGTNATGLSQPTAFTLDGSGNIFVTEQGGLVQEFSAGVSNTIVTITNAGVQLQGIAIFDDGAIAVSDAGNHVIWQINVSTKAVSLLTGKLGVPGSTLGSTNFARLNQPHQLARAANNQLITADFGNNRVVVVQRSGSITNVLKSANSTVWFGIPGDPVATNNVRWVPMVSPVGVALSAAGTVYTSEILYNDIRGIPGTGLTQPPAPPFAVLPFFNGPMGIALDISSSVLFIADQNNNAVQVLNFGDNSIFTFLGAGDGLNRPVAVAVDTSDNLYVLNQGTGGNGSILQFDFYGNLIGTNAAGLSQPTALTIDFAGNIFVTELGGLVQEFSAGVSNTIVTVDTNAGVQLQGIALFDDGTIAVSDAGNHVIWQINPVTKLVTRLTGAIGVPGSTLGAANFAKLNQPHQLAKAAGNQLIAADYGNNRLVAVQRSGSITNVLKSTNSVVWFGLPGDPIANSNVRWVPMALPVGVAIGAGGTVYSSETLYNDIRGILSTGFSQPPPPVPAPAPQIGWVDFQPPALPVSLLRVGSSFVFNNDVTIAILGTGDSQIYYTYGDTALASLIPDPTPTNGTTAPFYQDGVPAGLVPPSIISPQPDVTVKAVGANPGSPISSVVQARFQFVTANPLISGNNAAQFTLTDLTTGAQMWYSTDGNDPTNAAPSVGPILSGNLLSLNASSNVTFKVRAFRNNYQPSAVVSTVFSPSNFIPNRITFGLANTNSELHSAFLARPGQFFYAPVTLQLMPGGETMYSLQFNVAVTNALATTNKIVNSSDHFGFFPMLMSKVPPAEGDHFPPNDGQWYLEIPPFLMANITNDVGTSMFVNTNNNLLGVGWLFRQGYKYTVTSGGKTLLDFDTVAQDLIKYSIAHDTLFNKADGIVIVGAYSFQVPTNADIGDQYFMQLGSPSATRDGIGAPGADVYIRPPGTNQKVEVGTPSYLVGDAAPFRWLNAGDFGEGTLNNADVMQVFQSAILLDDMPPTNSDLYLAMDSCGEFGAFDGDNNYYTNFNTGAMSLAEQQATYDGGDSTINQVPFGDGQLDVSDVFVTFRRSLDPSLWWFRRYWINDQFVAVTTPNLAFNSNSPLSLSKALSMSKTKVGGDPSKSLIQFSAGDVMGGAGQTVQIPITARVFGDYPLRVLGLNITVEPLDGSPALTQPVVFSPDAGLGQPTIGVSKHAANYSAAWLDNKINGLIGDATIGTLTITIPSGATSMAAYAIHFDHASGSPNGIASFPEKTQTGLITLSSRTNSTYGDGIPDSWRLRYFGTVNNLLSQGTADADGDGFNNLHEYIAGTDPLDPKSNLHIGNDQAAAQPSQDCVIHWPSVFGKQYVIERSANLFAPTWTSVSTNNGTGTEMEIHDSSGGNTRFYRVRVLP